jgi:hypothetical protein
MTYVHLDDTTDEITYSEYNFNTANNTDLPYLYTDVYQNRQKYLLAWTQKS